LTTRTEEYAAQSRELLEKGQEALSQGDLVQASEKLWGAAAQMVKSVAERRGWPHSSHRDLFRVVSQLAQETGDTRMRSLFQLADSLHTNFYENWMTREYIEDGVPQVQELISKLERI
jgi:hypothetical protein